MIPQSHQLLQERSTISYLLELLEGEMSPAVQTVVCIGFSKLMLAGSLNDERVMYHFYSYDHFD